jgi:hypothetical protein
MRLDAESVFHAVKRRRDLQQRGFRGLTGWGNELGNTSLGLDKDDLVSSQPQRIPLRAATGPEFGQFILQPREIETP